MFDPSQPPLVSETLLKKRRSLDELVYRRSTTVQVQNKRKRIVRGENVIVKRPEQFVREFRTKEGSENKMRRRKKNVERRSKCNSFDIRNTVGLVIRIHSGRHASDNIKSDLKKLKLEQKYDAVFTRIDDATFRKLKPLDAYVAYGYISNKAVNELIHRRAYTDYGGDGKRPLSDNLIVEKELGEKGILCLNDLTNEIYNVGSLFDDAIRILVPFKLSDPVGHFEKKILNVHDDVEHVGGYQNDEAMEQLVKKIL